MPLGKVKKVVKEKGFGFISPDSGPELFFHKTGVVDGTFESLVSGDQVEYDATNTTKGPRAENVKLVRS
jgi:CspA family cold shock protein